MPIKEIRIHDLSKGKLVRLLEDIRDILWLDYQVSGAGKEREFFNLDKQWDSETLEAVAGTLEDAGLKPEMLRETTDEDWLQEGGEAS